MTAQGLLDTAAEAAVLLNGHHTDLWLDRMFNMDFLADQMFGDDDRLTFNFALHHWPNVDRTGYHGYII